MYPIITHIDGVLPAIAGRQDFVVARREGYTAVDYVFAGADTFDCPIRRECRGLKFDAKGRLIARPFEKFFNVGEKPHTQPDLLDWSQPHTIMEKLDGSMIHPAIVHNEVVFMTRMGRTDVARKAERHLTRELAARLYWHLSVGLTPIFEFTAPDNRIVVDYPASALTLLAIRGTVGGAYMDRATLERDAAEFGVPVVPLHAPPTGAEFLDYARQVRGMEGFVVRFADGLTVKAKGEDYVLKHRARDSILQEKNVLALVLKGEIDDVLPMLEPADRLRVEDYRDDVQSSVRVLAGYVDRMVRSGARLDQKTFATEHLRESSKEERTLAFQVRSGADAHEAATAYLLKHTGSQTAVDSVRHLFRASLNPPDNDNVASIGAAA
ncbi:MAG: hypothetical protein FD152_764 [Xanthobacteraceae bacterium]|nr:MAG: hypothetical protein FD152_764 [Xanthobacteraceae bacterium]